MKMTRFALGAKCGGLGFRSYTRSLAEADSAAKSRSCWSMEFTAIAPNPIAASCNACLRVRNLFMALSSPQSYVCALVTIQEVIGPEHRLDKQAQAFLWILFRRDRLLRDLRLFRGGLAVVGHIEGHVHRGI